MARLLSSATHQLPGKLSISELFFEVPTDYSQVGNGKLRLFARGVERYEQPVDHSKKTSKQLPWFVFLQGGPGFGCKPPQNHPWLNIVLDRGYQVLFLDQRGTGLSSTVTAGTLAEQGPPADQAAYLKHFRADSIVKDCEAIRRILTASFPQEKQKWTLLGQSFGGFCCVNYLSRFPEGLQEVFTTGGLPPLVKHPDEVYERLFEKVKERNDTYYKKYPEDANRIRRIVRYLVEQEIGLPCGGRLSILRFRQLGMLFGAQGYMDHVHNMILRFDEDLERFGIFTRPTLAAFGSMTSFDCCPLYAMVHELCYLRGAASNWSADRVMRRFPDFMKINLNSDNPILFTGEMIFKAMFDDYDELSRLKDTADILAKFDDWPDLYDEEQLARNEVPLYSSTYVDDMYVHFDFARATASKIKNCKHFITNVMYHNALDEKSDDLMKQLFALRDDVID